jgi:hypothetical protein
MIRYACAVCKRIITDYRASVLPDGRIELVAQCHGERHTFRILPDMSGVLFHDRSVLELETRDPDEYIRRAREEGSKAVDRGASGRGKPPRRLTNAEVAALGE